MARPLHGADVDRFFRGRHRSRGSARKRLALGASSAAWSTADRDAYANDPEVLLSADDAANQIKGDKGPEAWKPPNRDYWCEYARRWIWIKSEWDLSVNPNEKTALNEMLATCKAD